MTQEDDYEAMFQPYVDLSDDDPIKNIFNVKSWALGLAIIDLDGSTNFWHGGNNWGYTASFMINPAERFGYVYFTNADQCNDMKKMVEDMLWK